MTLCRLLGLAGFTLFLISAFTPVPRLVALRLAGPSQFEAADAIVALARGGIEPSVALSTYSLRRTLYAVALYRQSLAPLVVLSGWPEEIDERARIATKLGVPEARLLTESRARTTHEEALLLRQRLTALGVRRVLLVADVIDTRRARAVFERAGFTVLSAPLPLDWTSDPDARLELVLELLEEELAWTYYRIAGFL